jgi:hypothetical protein
VLVLVLGLVFPALPGVVNEPLRVEVDGAVENDLLPEYPPVRLLELPPEYPFAKASVAPIKVNVSIIAIKTELIEIKRFMMVLSFYSLTRTFAAKPSSFEKVNSTSMRWIFIL